MENEAENKDTTLIPKKPSKFYHKLYETFTKKTNKNIYIPIQENLKNKKCQLVDFIKLPNIIISLLISLSFYFLLIILLIKSETTSLILFIIVFLVGHFSQSQVIPEFSSFKTKDDLIKDLKDIINSSVSKINENENKDNYYIYDAINELDIPEEIELIKFGELILYTDNELKREFDNVKICLKKEDKSDIDYFDKIYCLTRPIPNPVNYKTIILSLLLLQWIQALYYYLKWKGKMVVIYPMKLIVSSKIEEQGKPETKINIQGEKIIPKKEYIFKGERKEIVPINSSANVTVTE